MNNFIKINLLVILSILLTGIFAHSAQNRHITENQAKAAFVYNAARYMSWPTPLGSSLQIGILGKGSLSPEWKILSGKTLNGRKVSIFKSNDLEEMLHCHIIYLEDTGLLSLSRTLLLLREYPIFTIGDSPLFLSSGGIINLSLQDNRISFSVNLAQSRAVGLDISSYLLKLATEVIK